MGAKFPWELSGGMQQRASLCRALIHEPQLLMLDEPFGALDSFTREELWCVMRDLHAARQVTIILVTHDLREAAFLADRIFCMSARPGRIIAERQVDVPAPARSSRSPTRREFTDLVHDLRVADRQREAGGMTAGATTCGDRRRRPTCSRSPSSRLWEAACRLFKIPAFFLPAPSVIAQAGIEYWWQLLFHSFHTLWMTVAGFGIAVVFGILLGIALGASRIVNAGSQPLLVGFNAIPKVAVVPILILWFGVGWIPACHDRVPDLVLPHRGQRRDRPLHHRAGAGGRDEGAGRASKWDILVKIGIPRSMPYLFASLKVAITLAYVGSVIAESNASRYGIGNLITRASADFNVPLVFAALIALAILGVIIYAATVELERRMTGWAHRSGMGQG